MMNIYPENDYRTYLEHSSKAHKYISKKMGKAGKWIYTYVDTTRQKASNATSRLGKALSRPLNTIKRNRNLSKARKDIYDIWDAPLNPQYKVNDLVIKGRLSERNFDTKSPRNNTVNFSKKVGGRFVTGSMSRQNFYDSMKKKKIAKS